MLKDASKVIYVLRDLQVAQEMLRITQGDKPLQLFRFVETIFPYHTIAFRGSPLKSVLRGRDMLPELYDEGAYKLIPLSSKSQARPSSL